MEGPRRQGVRGYQAWSVGDEVARGDGLITTSRNFELYIIEMIASHSYYNKFLLEATMLCYHHH